MGANLRSRALKKTPALQAIVVRKYVSSGKKITVKPAVPKNSECFGCYYSVLILSDRSEQNLLFRVDKLVHFPSSIQWT